jgi:SulP family sulfate permease
MTTSLTFKPKLFSALKHYNRQQLTTDLLAGIIVGIVALPLAIAFGIASGVTTMVMGSAIRYDL